MWKTYTSLGVCLALYLAGCAGLEKITAVLLVLVIIGVVAKFGDLW